MPTPMVKLEDRTSGDTGVPFEGQLFNGDDTPVDLAGCDVYFKLVRDSDEAMQINMAPATVADADLAIVQYWPSIEDVDIAVTAEQESDGGVRYAGWFVVVTAENLVTHYPPNAKTLIYVFHRKYS
jgi:hypothetical protein